MQSEAPPQYTQPPYGPPSPFSQPPYMVQPSPMGYLQPPMQQQSTVVVVNQPSGPANRPPRSWSTGLCGCYDDIAVCCCVCFCEPCAECKLATDMGESCCLPCIVPGWLLALRTKQRTQHNIQGSIMDDCCTIHWCRVCVLCQMMREVKLTRGT